MPLLPGSGLLPSPYLVPGGGYAAPVGTDVDEIQRGSYMPGTNLEIPGLEAILEYGDASKAKRDHIPGAMLINDHSRLDRVRITQMDGLHDDPEASETRQGNADRYGESTSNMLYRGRTIGLTGRVEAGNIGAMRNNWRRFRGQFGVRERDLIIHHPFEVRALANEVLNPAFAVDTQTWTDPFTSSGSAALTRNVSEINTIGSLAVTGATGAGSVRTSVNLLDDAFSLPQVAPWTGQDVWITALVRVASTTLTVGTVSLGLTEWFNVVPGVGASSTVPVTAAKVTRSAPATGTWYLLSLRVPANAFKLSTYYLTPTVQLDYSNGGNATLSLTAVAMVFIDADEPSPVAYFDGDAAGHDWQGVPHLSRSVGPTHAENTIFDPFFANYNPQTNQLTNWLSSLAGGTVNQQPALTRRWKGDLLDRSGYYKATKDNNTTARYMGVVVYDNNVVGHGMRVVAGRRYRFSAKVNLIAKPATGNVTLTLEWLNSVGVSIGTVEGDVLALGENDGTVSATAPTGAFAVFARIWNSATTTANAVLEMHWSDPCFVDVTDWDPGDFVGEGDRAEETSRWRRIPRPFLLQGVRKTSDMKAPEQQSRSRAWRDFTMSLRASDPRIYCFDERRISSKMPAGINLQFVIATGSAFSPSLRATAPAPVPTGFTYEGESIPSTVSWSGSAPNLP
jgi:hypothetical protein